MKVRDVIRIVETDGWFVVRMRGSHRRYHDPTKPGTVTIAGKPGQDMDPKTLANIWKQADIEPPKQ